MSSSKRHWCPRENCTKSFTREQDLVRHVNLQHALTHEYVCERCESQGQRKLVRFKRNTQLNGHLERIHKEKHSLKDLERFKRPCGSQMCELALVSSGSSDPPGLYNDSSLHMRPGRSAVSMGKQRAPITPASSSRTTSDETSDTSIETAHPHGQDIADDYTLYEEGESTVTTHQPAEIELYRCCTCSFAESSACPEHSEEQDRRDALLIQVGAFVPSDVIRASTPVSTRPSSLGKPISMRGLESLVADMSDSMSRADHTVNNDIPNGDGEALLSAWIAAEEVPYATTRFVYSTTEAWNPEKALYISGDRMLRLRPRAREIYWPNEGRYREAQNASPPPRTGVS